MAQKAILKFVKADEVTPEVIRITQGENVPRLEDYSHVNLLANDFGGADGSDKVYLLAPFDCVVKALGSSNGNTVFFESTCEVETAAGNIEPVVSIMCTHMDTNDYNAMGFYVGKPFSQGQIIYREGISGNANGYHIHLEQALGGYNGSNDSTPSIKHGNNTWLDGSTVTQVYRINADNPVPCTSVFFAGCTIDTSEPSSGIARDYKWKHINSEGVVTVDDGYVAESGSSSTGGTETIQTMMIECTQASMQNGFYPTRPSKDASYDPNDYFIAPGDILKLQDIKAGTDGNVICHVKYSLVFNRLEDLSNRWFVYDKDYFN